MNQKDGLLRATMRGARWALPWLSMLAISASVAYAITAGAAHAPSASDGSTTISDAQVSARDLVAEAGVDAVTATIAVDRLGTVEACDTTGGRMLYVGLNTWISADVALSPCPGS